MLNFERLVENHKYKKQLMLFDKYFYYYGLIILLILFVICNILNLFFIHSKRNITETVTLVLTNSVKTIYSYDIIEFGHQNIMILTKTVTNYTLNISTYINLCLCGIVFLLITITFLTDKKRVFGGKIKMETVGMLLFDFLIILLMFNVRTVYGNFGLSQSSTMIANNFTLINNVESFNFLDLINSFNNKDQVKLELNSTEMFLYMGYNYLSHDKVPSFCNYKQPIMNIPYTCKNNYYINNENVLINEDIKNVIKYCNSIDDKVGFCWYDNSKIIKGLYWTLSIILMVYQLTWFFVFIYVRNCNYQRNNNFIEAP